MSRSAKSSGSPDGEPIEQYEHTDKTRLNNPPVGLVTVASDVAAAPKQYSYDPHLDPQLVWAGKAERTSFEVPTVSLHVHERIDPLTIINAVRKDDASPEYVQGSLFEQPRERPPLRQALDFYKHKHSWSNRLIAGDSLLVMNSLLEKEGMAGQVQMVYFDPPYGVKYGSNFQPFVNRRDVTDGKDEDLTQEPEMIHAFRDTWELGIHSYLSYLRDRLLLVREILAESGSCFVQISDGNVHLVRSLLDEVFGSANFVSIIPFRKKTMPLGAKLLEQMYDFILWYAKRREDTQGRLTVKYRPLFLPQTPTPNSDWSWFELPDGTRHKMTTEQIDNPKLLPQGARVYRLKSLEPSGTNAGGQFDFEFEGRTYSPPRGGWGTTNMGALKAARRLQPKGELLNYVLFFDDYPVTALTSPWTDTVGPQDKRYVVQTSDEVITRCILMTSDPGDLVLDPTCGGGTTAYVAEEWGRRWITCDTSRVAITLAKQRLMTAQFDYYELAHPDEGVSSGFRYKTAPHITLSSIAKDEPTKPETLYNRPHIDTNKARVTGPFTLEAVPAPAVKALDDTEAPALADASVARSGPTVRQAEWRDELLKTGIRARNGQTIGFSRVEPLGGTRFLHAEAETKEDRPKRVVVSFGSDYAPLEQRQVESALEEASTLLPRPALVLFAAFQFDPEAAKDIDELSTERTGFTLLKAQMNTDLLTEDLKKKRASNQSFWLIGQPDVGLRQIKDGDNQGKWEVEIRGFDYYSPATGLIESGDTTKIAVWLLDPDYDGRSLFPRQVFFPLAGPNDGWARLAKSLRAEIDEERIEAYRGTVSLPFELGAHRRVAVKIVDDRGIESLRIIQAD